MRLQSGLKEFFQSSAHFERILTISFKVTSALKVALHSACSHHESKRLPSQNAGKVIRTPKSYSVFIPAKLPPTLTYDTQFVLALSQDDWLIRLLGIASLPFHLRHLKIP
jgi:hypothetical protein